MAWEELTVQPSFFVQIIIVSVNSHISVEQLLTLDIVQLQWFSVRQLMFFNVEQLVHFVAVLNLILLRLVENLDYLPLAFGAQMFHQLSCWSIHSGCMISGLFD